MTARAAGRFSACAAALAAACAGGGSARLRLDGSGEGARAPDWDAARETWTRHGTARKDLFTAIDVHATFLSWEARQALVARRAEWFALPPAARAGLLRNERSLHQGVWEVVAGVRSSREEWNDLQSPSSVWRIALVDDRGREVTPARVLRWDRPDETDARLFPYLAEVFTVLYRIRFPRALPDGSAVLPPDAPGFTLRIAGSLGRVELRWDLR